MWSRQGLVLSKATPLPPMPFVHSSQPPPHTTVESKQADELTAVPESNQSGTGAIDQRLHITRLAPSLRALTPCLHAHSVFGEGSLQLLPDGATSCPLTRCSVSLLTYLEWFCCLIYVVCDVSKSFFFKFFLSFREVVDWGGFERSSAD